MVPPKGFGYFFSLERLLHGLWQLTSAAEQHTVVMMSLGIMDHKTYCLCKINTLDVLDSVWEKMPTMKCMTEIVKYE